MLKKLSNGLKRLTLMHTLVLATFIAVGVFVVGQQVLIASDPCDDQCTFLGCWTLWPPQGPGCGGCGQWVRWDEFYVAGKNCISCGEGTCIATEKINPDQCGECDFHPAVQCFTCLT
jgi:hypothetical protein